MQPDETPTVLLIEDDQAMAEMYRLKLESDGYRVQISSDGEDGVAQALAQRPELIFLDIRLPRMDGFAVLEKLRATEETRFIPVVILSAYGEPELKERGLRLGALEYVIKSQTTPAMISARVPGWAAALEPETSEPPSPTT
jgi:two-component system phosphate regulon response regulator PhoB